MRVNMITYLTSRKLLAAILFVILAAGNLWAENSADPMGGGRYRISADREYHIDGKTKAYILDNYLDFNERQNFASLEELEEYIDGKQQELLNRRIFHQGRIEYEIREVAEAPDEAVLDIYVEDTMNRVVLPYFKFDSNDGLLLSLRGRDYNFFGSMQPLEANIDYWYTEDGEHEVSLNSEFSLPFRLWGFDWVFDISEDAVYKQEDPFELKLGTDLGIFLPFWNVQWKLTASQDYILNEDKTNEISGYYLKSGLSFGGDIATGLTLDGFDVEYSPNLSSEIPYKFGEQIRTERRGVESSFDHSVSFGRVDWVKNFRQGYSVELSNSNTYNFYQDDWAYSIEGELQGHVAGDWVGVDSRLKAFYMIDAQKDNVGGPLRGVLDHRIDEVKAGAYMNLDMPFPMWVWFMSRWFEAQISPFFDAAYFQYGGSEADWSPLWYGAGIEGFAYLKASRSIYLRVSLGVDMQAMLEGGGVFDPAPRDDASRLELYIGLGHHY